VTLTVHENLEQGSEEWLAARRGLVTASVVGQLISIRTLGAIDHPCPACSAAAHWPCLSKTKADAAIKTLHSERADHARSENITVIEPAKGTEMRSLALLLAAERITGWTDPTFISNDMQRGLDDEPIARAVYADHYAPVTEVGFMTEDQFGFPIGYSPDGLVGINGLIEVKSRRAKTQLATILADEVPAENMAQLQCGLLVSGREWIDYVSFCGGMPLYVKRVEPQDEWLDAIVSAIDVFERTVAEMVNTYRNSVVGLHMTERILELEMF
jgi:hypothetical protein